MIKNPETYRQKLPVLFITLFNLTGLTYLLALGYLSLPAQDDYAFVTYMRQYGFNSPFLYWYGHWQGRFTAQYAINAEMLLWQHHFPLLVYYIFILGVAIAGVYNLLKNALIYFGITVIENSWALLNSACIIVLLGIYANFEFNTFYWLNASTMYIGGVVFFIFGLSEIISRKQGLASYLIVALSFLYVGGSSENFAFIAITVTGLFLILRFFLDKPSSLLSFFKMATVQKFLIAIVISGLAFIVMIKSPGNQLRMKGINILFKGYKTVPVPLAELPYEVFSNYKILLALALSRLPVFLSVFPIFALSAISIKPLNAKTQLKNLAIATLSLLILMYFFILPTVYATALLGPLRSLTFLSFFLCIFTYYAAFVLGNILKPYQKGLTVLAICSAIGWAGIFIHDIRQQVPELQKYTAGEKSRLKLLAQLKSQNTTGNIVLDSLYTPHFKSYSNVVRNQIIDRLKKQNILSTSYYPILFDPLFYNEISIDTSFYVNVDLKNAYELPFTIQLKK